MTNYHRPFFVICQVQVEHFKDFRLFIYIYFLTTRQTLVFNLLPTVKLSLLFSLCVSILGFLLKRHYPTFCLPVLSSFKIINISLDGFSGMVLIITFGQCLFLKVDLFLLSLLDFLRDFKAVYLGSPFHAYHDNTMQ